MVRTIASFAAVLLFASALHAQPAEKADVEFMLLIDRRAVRPGELLQVRVYCVNKTEKMVRVLQNWPAQIHVATPSGTFTFGRGDEERRPITIRDIDAGSMFELQSERIRLSRHVVPDRRIYNALAWYDAKGQVAQPNFAEPGNYRIWFEHSTPQSHVATPAILTERLRSKEATFEVRPLKPDEVRREATPEQLAWVEDFFNGRFDRKDSLGRTVHSNILDAMLRAENDGLANALLSRLERVDVQPDVSHYNLPEHVKFSIPMLVSRAASDFPMSAGIDGSYLDKLAEILIARTKDPKQYPIWEHADAIPVLYAYAQLRTNDERARKRAIDALTFHARLPQENETQGRMATAWIALLDLGVLRPGMTVDEVTALIGTKPTSHADTVSWSHSWTLRPTPPRLDAKVRDGRIVSFDVYR